MTEKERDDMIRGTHDAVIVMVKQVKSHGDALFGNGKPGIVKDVTLLQERQDQCPARKANSVDSKRLNIATIMMAVAIVGLLTTSVLGILNYIK